MKYHILIWRSTYQDDQLGACVFFKRGCRCLSLRKIRDWKDALHSNSRETALCGGYESEKDKHEKQDTECADFFNGKFEQRDEDPRQYEIIAKITADSLESAVSEIRSYLLTEAL